MIIIGLTGSIAMGKSTAAQMLARLPGVAVHDSDAAVRALYGRAEVIDLIKTTFPQSYDRASGGIDKAALVRTLGIDGAKWDALEAILHPYVRELQDKFLREQRALGTRIAVLDIPLLFETGGQARVDYTICVSAPEFIQQQRLDARIRAGVLSAEDAAFRLSRQMPDAQKRARADFVVPTGQGLAMTQQALEKIVNDLHGRQLNNGNGHNGHRGFSPH